MNFELGSKVMVDAPYLRYYHKKKGRITALAMTSLPDETPCHEVVLSKKDSPQSIIISEDSLTLVEESPS